MFGAIESTNVVGYQGLQANATRQTMIAPTFLGVGNETGCTLADLKVVGYDPAEDDGLGGYEGGCSHGDFVVQFLNSNGTVASRYWWVDDGETGPAWCDKTGTPIDASEVSIKAGVAMWIIGSGYKLQAAGAVNKNDVQFTMNTTRQTAVGNSMPVALTLDDLSVEGYDAAEDDGLGGYEGGCSHGDFVVQFLNPNGTVAERYWWVDDGETGPAWCDKTGTPIDGTTVSIPAGKGMWIIGSGLKLNIPAPEL